MIYIVLLGCFFLSSCSNSTLDKDFLNIAHRGASASAPEHTFAAYDEAIKEKADYIELDLQMTKDKKLVAIHDNKVDRTTDGDGLVKNKTLLQIRKLDAGSHFDKTFAGEKIPELSDILKKYYNKTNFYIETKTPEIYPEMDQRLLKELNSKALLSNSKLKKGKVIVQSFSEKSLINIYKVNKKIPLIKLINDDNVKDLTDIELERLSKYMYGIGINQEKVNRELVERIQDKGLKVHVFTLNTEKEVKKMKSIGVDGVFNNNP